MSEGCYQNADPEKKNECFNGPLFQLIRYIDPRWRKNCVAIVLDAKGSLSTRELLNAKIPPGNIIQLSREPKTCAYMQGDNLNTRIVCDEAQNVYAELDARNRDVLAVHDGTSNATNTLSHLRPLFRSGADSIALMVNIVLIDTHENSEAFPQSVIDEAGRAGYQLMIHTPLANYSQHDGYGYQMKPHWFFFIR